MREKGSILTIVLVVILVGIILISTSYFLSISGQSGTWLQMGKTGPNPSSTTLPKPSPSVDPLNLIPDKTPQEIGIDLTQKRLYFQEMSLYLGSLDGKINQLIYPASGNDKVGIAGAFLQKNHVYYTLIQDKNIEQIFLFDLTTNQASKIFEFPISNSELETFKTNAQMSTDENSLAFTGVDGIYIYSIITKQTKQVAKNNTKCDQQGFDCFGYGSPNFSADIKFLWLERGAYERAYTTIVNLSSGVVKDTQLPSSSIWSKQGHMLMTTGYFYGDGELVKNPDEADTKSISLPNTLSELKDSDVIAADWSESGTLALEYSDNKSGKEKGGIGLYDLANNSFKTIAHFASFPDYASITWLDNDQGLLLTMKDNMYVVGIKSDGKYKLSKKFN